MVIRVLGERQILLLGIQEKEQVAVLEHQQQKELEDFIYRAAFLLADVGFFQEPAYTKLPDGISKPALNFRVVISVSMVYHKIGTFLRYFFDFANLIIPENRCFLLSMYKYICIQSQKFKGFQLVWSVGSLRHLQVQKLMYCQRC